MFNYSPNPYSNPYDGSAAPFRGLSATKDLPQRLALSERLCTIEAHRLQPATVTPPKWVEVYPPQGTHANKGLTETPKPAKAETQFVRLETVSKGDELLKIQAFSKACLSSSAANTLPFKRTSRGWEATSQVGFSLLEAMPHIERWAQLRHEHDDMEFDPLVQIAIDAYLETGLWQGTSLGAIGNTAQWYARGCAFESAAVVCNGYVPYIRQRAQKIGVGRDIQRHHDKHLARARELRSYFSKLAKRHPASSVKRVELCMSRCASLNATEEWKLMVSASKSFVDSVKTAFGTAVVGDVRKLDAGPAGTYLAHVLLALDGPSEQELEEIDETLSELWDVQTSGLGYLIDCNAVAAFTYRGMGAAALPYETIASVLDKAAVFLSDTDRLVHVGYNYSPDGLLLGSVPR